MSSTSGGWLCTTGDKTNIDKRINRRMEEWLPYISYWQYYFQEISTLPSHSCLFGTCRAMAALAQRQYNAQDHTFAEVWIVPKGKDLCR
jgi:hypothetical protein